MLKQISILALCAISLSACEGQREHRGGGFDNPWRATAERMTYHEEVNFSSKSAAVSSAEKRKINALFDQAQADMKIYARIQAPRSIDPKTRTLMTQRVAALKNFLIQEGIKSNDIEVLYLEPVRALDSTERNTVMLMLDQYKVIPPVCPGWGSIDSNASPQGEDQFACVTERNFAQMIAEPRDLYRGQITAPADGHYQIEAIKRYRTGKITPLKIEKIEKQQ